jgi:phage protein U
MATPLLQLGSYQFGIDTAAHESLDRTDAYRWVGQDRLLREVAYQYVGPGDRKITLPGTIYPHFRGGLKQLDAMRAEAERGTPLMLTDGLGKVLGKWVILSVKETQSVFLPGGAPRKIDFSLELASYGEDNPGERAAPTSTRSSFGDYNGVAPVSLNPALAFDPNSAQKLLDTVNNYDFAPQAVGSGFSFGQLMGIAQAAVNQDYVGAVMGAFGLAGAASSEWAQVGLSAVAMGQAFAQGRGPEAVAIGLEQLAGLGPGVGPVVQSIAGAAAAPTLQSLVNSAATLTGLLDRDPFITGQVRTQLTGGGN